VLAHLAGNMVNNSQHGGNILRSVNNTLPDGGFDLRLELSINPENYVGLVYRGKLEARASPRRMVTCPGRWMSCCALAITIMSSKVIRTCTG
jgi:hypothetical protein